MSTFMNTDPKAFSGVWVFCEQRQGKMMPTTFELISEGRKLADELGVELGGILLGAGGLVRAYSKAVQEGLAASTVILKQKGIVLQITTDYTGIGKIQYIAGERSLPILDSEYTDRVVLKLLVSVQEIGSVENAITEGTNGRAQLKQDGECYYSVIDGEVQTFDH